MDYQRIKKEIRAYSDLADDRLKSNTPQLANRMIGTDLVNSYLSGEDVVFPHSTKLWIDSVGNPITQITAYNWLVPIKGVMFMQLGSSGSHAIKALIAGAHRAILLTPSAQEGRVAREIAEYLGIVHKLDVVVGIGEQLPFDSGSVDRIYGGGTLHHVHLDNGLAELARVLAPGGRAAFVEPRLNFIYRFLEITKIRELAREPGAQCYPLKVSEVLAVACGFNAVRCELSGGPARYAIVGLNRILGLNVSLSVSVAMQSFETKVLSVLRLKSLLGSLAVLLEK